MPAAVVNEEEVEPTSLKGAQGELRVLIDTRSGAEHVLLKVLRLSAGNAQRLSHPGSDDILYVAEGRAEVSTFGGRVEVGNGSGVFAARKSGCRVGGNGLLVVWAMSPAPREGYYTMEAYGIPPRTVSEDDQRPIPAGDDRSFKILVDPRLGAEHATQFVGFIRKSKAPPHTHIYEEAIYILEGEGIVHIGEDRHEPIRPGTSIFLPPGTPHCLENRGEQTLKLLGVFSPPGSPANKAEEPAEP